MVGRTNAGGGAVSTAWAYIAVTYPAGSTCTATNGTTTLNAQGTSGLYVFQIPKPTTTPETWTVSCTNGTKTKSGTVKISTQYSAVAISLSYIRLPEGYQEVEYVQNIGYFSIGLLRSDGTGNAQILRTQEIDINFLVPSARYSGGTNNANNANQTISIGSTYQVSNTDTTLGVSNLGSYYGTSFSSLTETYSATIQQNRKYTLIFNDSNHKCKLDSTVFDTWNTSALDDNTWNVYMSSLTIFGQNTSAYTQLETRVSSVVIKNHSNGSYAHEWIPCYRKSDNAVGFYDNIANKFAVSERPSTFAKGPDV